MTKIQVDIPDDVLAGLRKKFEICIGSKEVPIAKSHLVRWCVERWIREPIELPESPKKPADPPKENPETPDETTPEIPETPEIYETYPRKPAPRLKDVLEAIKRHEDIS